MTTLESPTTKPCHGKRKENTQEHAPSIPNPYRDGVHESTPSPTGKSPTTKTRRERQVCRKSKTAVIPGAARVQAQPCFQKHMLAMPSHPLRPPEEKEKEIGKAKKSKTNRIIIAFHVVTHPHSRCPRSPSPTYRRVAHPHSSHPYAAHPCSRHHRSCRPQPPDEHHGYDHPDQA